MATIQKTAQELRTRAENKQTPDITDPKSQIGAAVAGIEDGGEEATLASIAMGTARRIFALNMKYIELIFANIDRAERI